MSSSIRCKASGRQLIGLLASAIAFAALFITAVSGNRSLGFGRSISEVEPESLLVLAGLLFISQVLIIAFAKRCSKRGASATEIEKDPGGKQDHEI
ncbi:MAG: hypothetical protein M3Y72_22095 [Acidobacteriota bacterium]|nr:hypothetical protein [Acidobacteriota bacterium]